MITDEPLKLSIAQKSFHESKKWSKLAENSFRVLKTPPWPPQSETVPARIFRFFMCLRQKTPLSLCLCHFQCQTLLFLFFSLPNLFRFICLLPSNVSFNTSNTIQIVFLAIVPGKLEMCLQENLVDCTDCGSL